MNTKFYTAIRKCESGPWPSLSTASLCRETAMLKAEEEDRLYPALAKAAPVIRIAVFSANEIECDERSDQ